MTGGLEVHGGTTALPDLERRTRRLRRAATACAAWGLLLLAVGLAVVAVLVGRVDALREDGVRAVAEVVEVRGAGKTATVVLALTTPAGERLEVDVRTGVSERYPVGSDVVLHHDPDDPRHLVTEDGDGTGGLDLLGVLPLAAAAALLPGAVGLHVHRRRLRRRVGAGRWHLAAVEVRQGTALLPGPGGLALPDTVWPHPPHVWVLDEHPARRSSLVVVPADPLSGRVDPLWTTVPRRREGRPSAGRAGPARTP